MRQHKAILCRKPLPGNPFARQVMAALPCAHVPPIPTGPRQAKAEVAQSLLWLMRTFLIVLAFVAVLLAGALALFLWLRSRRRQGSGENKLTALVFLLREPRQLADWQVRQAAARALGIELVIGDRPEPNTILPVPAEKVKPDLPPGAGMTYFINTGSRMFLINSFAQPYMEKPGEVAATFPDQRLRAAVANHTAWISADLYGETPAEADRAEIYRLLGRMLAPLGGDDCTAIFCPELERCNEYGPSVLEALQTGRPLEIFESPTFAPVINVAADDARMVAAVEEARRRWPEFVAAFRARTDPEVPFIVKARFCEGDVGEFMWMSVQSITGERITGRLENSPAQLQKLKEGDPVTVAVSDLNDWLCQINGEPAGGFTVKVLNEVMNPERDDAPSS